MKRQDICLKNKVDLCPMSSYKQCTNNRYALNKCNCFERSFELCDKNNQFSDKCYYNLLKKDLDIISDNNSKNNRVNIYHGQRTSFDYLK